MNIFVTSIASLIIAITSFYLSSEFGEHNYEAQLILMTAIIPNAYILIDSALNPKSSILFMIVSYYNISMFIIPGMIHSAKGYFPFFLTEYPDSVVTYGSILTTVYSICLMLGYLHARHYGHYTDNSSNTNTLHQDTTITIVLATTMIIISAGLIAALGKDIFTTPRSEMFGEEEASPVTLLMYYTAKNAIFVSMIFTYIKLRTDRGPILLMIFIPLLALTLFTNNPLATTRFQLFGFIVIFLFVTGYIKTVASKVIMIILLVFGQFVLLPFQDAIARGTDGGSFEFKPIEYLSIHGDFDGFQSLLSTIILVQATGLRFGYQFLGAVLTFIPREYWTTKPYATGVIAAEEMGFRFTNLSAPMPAEIYADFGFLGIVIISCIIGHVLTRIDYNAQNSLMDKRNFVNVLLYGGCIGYVTIVFRGSLIAIMFPIYTYFTVVMIWKITYEFMKKY